MDHVPTLCALSTVGIAAAGFALGCPEPATTVRSDSKKRRAGDTYRSFSAPLAQTTSSTTPPTPSPEVASSGSVARNKGATRPPNINETPVPRKASNPEWNLTSHDSSPGLLLSPDYTNTRADQAQDGTFSSRKSSSWLRRISTSSSYNESVSRPTTPSISFSNNSSTTPILPGRLETPGSQPNKLVKRTTSQRVLRQTPAPSASFRRPATSHQRSAQLLQQMALEEERATPPPITLTAPMPRSTSPPSPTWRPYFDINQPGSQPRKRHTSGFSRMSPLKTITNDMDELPTLLMATSITPRDSEDDIDDIEDRPVTRMGDDLPSDDEFDGSVSGQSDQEYNSKARNSFSLGDIFSPGSSNWKITRSLSLQKKKTGSTPDTVKHSSSPLVSPPSQASRKERAYGRLQKRRNITDPGVFKAPKVPPRLDLSVGTNNDEHDVLRSPLPPVTGVSDFEIDLPGGTPTYPNHPVRPFPEAQPYSNNLTHLISMSSAAPPLQSNATANPRSKRFSQAGSDPASTLIGSDGETRVFTSGDEDSMEFQSDTAFDSLATRATASSHSGLRGPRIETIFDESPPPAANKDKLISLQDLIRKGSFSERYSSKSSRRSELEESDGDDDNFSTPIKAPTNDCMGSELRPGQHPSISSIHDRLNFSSSPPSGARQTAHIRIQPAVDSDNLDEDGDDDWDFEAGDSDDEEQTGPRFPHLGLNQLSPLAFRLAESGSAENWLTRSTNSASKRSSIFEWSEQSKPDKDSINGASPRPKTVHGKQGKDGRGSRAANRRGPSTLHLRSQSVPVTRDGPSENTMANANVKFSTWGLGNKGVSEEWNDDFEFDETEDDTEGNEAIDQPSLFAAKGGMKVPQSIIDRQASVHVQFGQVQELTMLVEELKRLRSQGTTLELIDGPSSGLWKEAEAIINLATLDEEDETFCFPQSPSSPTFGFDEFDDDSILTNKTQTFSSFAGEGHQRRNSVLRRSTSSPATPPSGRPRGESSAQAKSFLQNMYQNRNEGESTTVDIPRKTTQDKMPFDTQDLRNLVTRAGVLTRALKEIVRRAEGVSPSPHDSPTPRSQPLSELFNPAIDDTPGNGSPIKKSLSFSSDIKDSSNKQTGLPKNSSSHQYLRGSVSPNNENDIAGQMKLMTVV